jgi:hypothetical protein
MTERNVTIRLDLVDQIGDRLLEVRKQRDALLSKSRIGLSLDPSGLDQTRRSIAQAGVQATAATKDLDALGGALLSKAVAPAAQYQKMLGSALQAGKAIGPGIVSALKGVSVEFQRQRDLASFWGTSGYIHGGVASLKSAMSSFLATGASGFANWLQNTSANLVQYRTALVATAAVMVGMAASAALSSKHSQNYIAATLDSRLMARKLTDKAGAAGWIESAQGTDWSAGRESRMGVFQTVLSKNKAIGQKQAQQATEDIEKFFFANQEMLQKKGFTSAEQLASAISAPQLSGEDATKFEDIFGLGFSSMSATARLGRLSTEAKGIDINKAVAARPDEVMSKRLTATTAAMGDAVLPALNAVLGGFLKLSDIIGKIPGFGQAMGWGAVLLGAAAAGLTVVSMIGSLIPGLTMMMRLVKSDTIARYANIAAQYAQAAASQVVAAAQWLVNAAMTANPIGMVIVAVAGLIAILYALEKKFGVVTKAWKAFSESNIGKGIISYVLGLKKSIEDTIASLGKAFRGGDLKGMLKIGLDLLSASSPGFKIIMMIVDFLKRLWINSGILNKLISTATGLWQKMVDFFNWLLDSIKSLAQWLKDGLGITKAEKRAEVDEAAKKLGVTWSEDRQAWMKGNQLAKDAGVSEGAINRLEYLRKEADKAPAGVIEKAMAGITQFVKEGLGIAKQEAKAKMELAERNAGLAWSTTENKYFYKGIDAGDPSSGMNPATLAEVKKLREAYNNASGGIFSGIPGLTELTDAITNLKKAIQDWLKKFGLGGDEEGETPPATPAASPDVFNPVTGIGKQGDTTTLPGTSSGTGGLNTPRQFQAPLAPMTPNSIFSAGNEPQTFTLPTGATYKPTTAGDLLTGKMPHLAAGGPILSSGSLVGHKGEEMDPARVVSGGKTTLARINELVGDGQGGSQVVVHAPVSVSITAQLSGNMDIDRLATRIGSEGADKLLFALRNKLNSGQLRDIGYMRG